jgi:hypothetical protein
MKSVSFISSKNNGLEVQFKSLNSSEMFNLRGGKKNDPPPTDTTGDLIIPFGKKGKKNVTVPAVQPLPVVGHH